LSNQVKYDIVAIDSFSGIAEKIKRNTEKLRRNFGNLGNQADKTRFKFSKLKAGIAAVAGGVVVTKSIGAFKKLVSVGADFEDSLLDLSAITGAQGKELDILAEKSKDMGVKYGAGASSVAQAMKLIASAKPELLENQKALVSMTDEVLKLQTAAGMDTETAALVTARALNIFGKSADQAGKFVNILAAGSKFGSSEIRDTGEAVLIAGGAAKSAGLSFVELNALIQATAKGGFVAQKAGTGLQAILSRLPKVGLDIKKVGLENSFELIDKLLKETTNSTEKAALVEKIFGLEHQKVGFALIENRKLLSSMTKKLVGTDIAQEQATKRMSSFNFQVKILAARIQNKLIAAFERLRPKLLEMVAKFGNFIDSISDDQIDAFANKMNAILHTIIKLTEQLEKIGGYIDMIGKVKKSIPWFGFTPVVKNLWDLGKEKLQSFEKENATAPINNQETKSTIDLNINAPSGVVQGVTNKTTGTTNLNIGFNGRLATNGI
jgi:TP901 family phage tail tape measure protein